MSTIAAGFLSSMAQAIQTMVLYGRGHPARVRAVAASHDRLQRLAEDDPRAEFSFLGHEVIYRQRVLRELRDWEWSARFASAGVQRVELTGEVALDEYEQFLEEVLGRLGLAVVETAMARQERKSNIRSVRARSACRPRPDTSCPRRRG